MLRRIWMAGVVLALILSGCRGGVQPEKTEAERWAEATLAEMTVQQKAGQVIVSGITGTEMTPEMCLHLQTYMPGGVVLGQENIQDPQQARRLVQAIQECAGKTQPLPVFIAAAHEGERVDHFGEPMTDLPRAQAVGAINDPQAAYTVAEIAGGELKYSGFNMALGPVADVLTNPDSEIIGGRSYGSDPGRVSQMVAAAVRGYNAAGVIPVLKHYPGHGGVAADSHETLPVDNASLEELEATYLPPFRSGVEAGAPVIMTSHIAFPALGGDETATTLSKKTLDDLRRRLDFDGVILSDALRMKAVSGKEFPVAKAALQALEAGVDLLLLNFPGHAGLAHAELVDAILEKRLDEKRLDEAVRRVLILKAERGLTEYKDLAATEPDWEANQAAVAAIAGRSITVLGDAGERLPLSGTGRVLVLAPAENNWSADEALARALAEKGAQAEARSYPAPWGDPPPGEAELAEILAAAQGYDQVVVFTWQAHILKVTRGSDWQGRLVSALEASGIPLVVVAARSATDVLEFPPQTTVVGMLGTLPAQQEALVEVLMGERQAEGVNPLQAP